MKITNGRSIARSAGATPTFPTNTGISPIAQQRIDTLVSAANRKHAEALKTDGTQGFLFLKQRAGRPCTCQLVQTTADQMTLSTPQISASTSSTDSGSVSSSPMARSFRVRDYDGLFSNSLTGPKPPTGSTLQEIHQRRMAQRDDFTQAEMIPVEADQSIDDILAMADDFQDEDSAALQKQPTLARLYGGEKSPCAICFGSGFVGGYSLHAGQRLILDASDTVPATLLDCEIDRTTAPHSFLIERSGVKAVEWTVPVPTYFHSVLGIAVRNNIDPAVGFIIEAHTGNGNWNALTPAYLTALNGTATTLTIRVRPVTSDAPGTSQFRFTHVELLYQIASPLVVNLPTFERTLDYEQFDVLQTLSGVEFPASIPMLDREAVLVDTKYNQAWNVVSVESRRTASNQTFNNVVSLRLIQQYETKYLLNLARGKVVELVYPNKLETVQGQQP